MTQHDPHPDRVDWFQCLGCKRYAIISLHIWFCYDCEVEILRKHHHLKTRDLNVPY